MSTYRRTNLLLRLWRLGTAFFSFWLLPSMVALLSLAMSVGGVAVRADAKSPCRGSFVGYVEIADCCVVYVPNCFIDDTGENRDNGIPLNHIIVSNKTIARGELNVLGIDRVAIMTGTAGWIDDNVAINMLAGHTRIFVPSNDVDRLRSIPLIQRPSFKGNANVSGGSFTTDVGISDSGINRLPRLQWINLGTRCGDACSFANYQRFMGSRGALLLRFGLHFRSGSEISVGSDQSVGLIRANFHFTQLPVYDVDGTIGDDSAGYSDQKQTGREDSHSDGGVCDPAIKLTWLFAIGWILAAAGLLRAIFWLVYDFGNTRYVVAALALAVASVGVAVYTTNGLIGALDRLP